MRKSKRLDSLVCNWVKITDEILKTEVTKKAKKDAVDLIRHLNHKIQAASDELNHYDKMLDEMDELEDEVLSLAIDKRLLSEHIKMLKGN